MTGAGGIGLQLQNVLGMGNLRLLNHMNAAGSTAAQMVQYATMAIDAGMATHVVCVFADAPLREGGSSAAAYGNAGAGPARAASSGSRQARGTSARTPPTRLRPSATWRSTEPARTSSARSPWPSGHGRP